MDKEIKKQLKGKNDDQWSKDQALDTQQNTRIFWYKFIVPGIFFVRSLPLEHSKRDLRSGAPGQWRPLFNKFKVGLTFQAVLLNLWQGITAR